MSKGNDCNLYYDCSQKTEIHEIAQTAINSVFGWTSLLIAIFIIYILTSSFVLNFVSVDGESMEPTLNNDDRVFVYSLFYEPQQNDIVLIGGDVKQINAMIKRVIATENQVVDIDYATGKVTVDGKVLDEHYVLSMDIPPVNEISYPYKVPQGHIFVMGDNRNESRDSRYKSVQAVDENRIVGKIIARLNDFETF